MKSVLIVLLGALGDVVRGFSVLAPIKRAFPECEITWLVEPKCAGIVKIHPLVDKILVYERPYDITPANFIFSIGRIYESIAKLKGQFGHYDLVLDLQRHFKSGLFSKFSGGVRRIGFSKRDCKEFNWIFNTEYIQDCDMKQSKVLHYQAFLEKAGIACEDVEFGMDDAFLETDIPELLRGVLADKRNNADLPSSRLVGLVMGSTWESKDWFIENYVKLATKLIEKYGCKVALFGDKTQIDIAEATESGVGSKFVINTAGKTSLRELFGGLKLADLVIGPDSGPGHLSTMLGTPYISLFGPTTHERVAPFGAEHLVMRTQLACSPCMKRECPGLDKICMRLLTPDKVMRKIDEIAESVGLIQVERV